jgi:hypothetical protein
MVREIVCVRPAAVPLVEHRAPDVVGILRTSARTHPCLAGVDDGNLRSLRHFVVRRRTQDVTRARIGLLAQLSIFYHLNRLVRTFDPVRLLQSMNVGLGRRVESHGIRKIVDSAVENVVGRSAESS